MKKIITLFALLLTFSFLTGCASTKEIPTDLTCAQLFQKGQTAYSNGNYKMAENYYMTVLRRFGTDNEVYVEAKYELGHLYNKTKNYKKAYDNLKELLDIYDSTPIGLLPTSYKKLATNELKKIPEAKLKEYQK